MKKSAILISALMLGVYGAFAVKPIENATKIVNDIKTATAPDARQAVYEITAFENGDGDVVVKGFVSEDASASALRNAFDAISMDYIDSIVVLPSDQWAQVRLSAASLRGEGRHAAEMVTQGVMGMPLRVLSTGGEWWRVQTPDGYISYVPSSSVVTKTPAEMEQWRKSNRLIVTAPYQTRVYVSPTANGVRDVVTDAVLGNIFVATGDNSDGRLGVELPDGRKGYIDADAVENFSEWATQDFNPEQILDVAYSMEGTPYLWGGTSVKAIDCSGLAKVSYFSNGLILMRDASQQALTGTRIEAKDWRDCQAGDLLFFGNAKTGRVTHVAIYDHDGNYVHSSGRVKRNSVDPQSPAYLTTPFLHAVRIHGNEGTKGITRVRDHGWYFNK